MKNEKDYVFAVSSKDDSSFKDRLIKLETKLEKLVQNDAETKLEKDKAIFDRRFAGFRKAMKTIIFCLVALLVAGMVLGTTVQNVSGGVVMVSVAFASLVLLVVLGVMSVRRRKPNIPCRVQTS